MFVEPHDVEYAKMNNYDIVDVELVFDKLSLDCVYDIDCILEDSDFDFQELVEYVKKGQIQLKNGRLSKSM